MFDGSKVWTKIILNEILLSFPFQSQSLSSIIFYLLPSIISDPNKALGEWNKFLDIEGEVCFIIFDIMNPCDIF